jgi:Forkhead domain
LHPNHFSQDAHDETRSERDQESLRTPEQVYPEPSPYSRDGSDGVETENIQWMETTPGHSNAHYRQTTHSYPQIGVFLQNSPGPYQSSTLNLIPYEPSSSISAQSSHGESLRPGLPTRTLPESFPDPGDSLRKQLGLDSTAEVSLWSLPDCSPAVRPSYPLKLLVKLAIYGSPMKKLTLKGIYFALEDRFEWFRNNSDDKSWKVTPFTIAIQLSLTLLFFYFFSEFHSPQPVFKQSLPLYPKAYF